MKKIGLVSLVGTFAEDKDVAAQLRRDTILPSLNNNEAIEIDFARITLTTQSFIHALIAEALRTHGEAALSQLSFKNCSTATRGIIETVVQYILESREAE